MKVIDDLVVGSPVPFDITQKHPVYKRMSSIWQKCRDAYSGEDAIKARGEEYLPRLNNQADADYHKYKVRSQWYGATGRTVQAYLGMLFRKNPVFKYKNKKNEPLKDDNVIRAGEEFFSLVTFDGKSIEDFLRTVVEEVLTINKLGILVDFPPMTDEFGNVMQMNQYQYEASGYKPLLSTYKAESIINWYWEIINSRIVPRFFVLAEESLAFDDDCIVPEEITNYRILYLQKTPQGFVYKQYVVEGYFDSSDDKEKKYRVIDIITPLQDGKPLDFIPFYIMTDKGLDYRDNSASMIEGLVNTNIGHYRNSADWENELHWVGIKTLYLPGWDKEAHGEVTLGGALAGPAGSEPKMIEPKSDSGIKEEMKNKEERMAVLGAERIAQKGRYIPSAETAKINAESENATLINMSKSLSVSISKVLTYQLEWAAPGKNNVIIDMQLNTDFFDEFTTGDEVLKWIQATQQGGISFDAYFYNMQKKEVFPPNWTMDQEINKLQEGYPGGEPGNPDDDDDTTPTTAKTNSGNTETDIIT